MFEDVVLKQTRSRVAVKSDAICLSASVCMAKTEVRVIDLAPITEDRPQMIGVWDIVAFHILHPAPVAVLHQHAPSRSRTAIRVFKSDILHARPPQTSRSWHVTRLRQLRRLA